MARRDDVAVLRCVILLEDLLCFSIFSEKNQRNQKVRAWKIIFFVQLSKKVDIFSSLSIRKPFVFLTVKKRLFLTGKMIYKKNDKTLLFKKCIEFFCTNLLINYQLPKNLICYNNN